jgi:hypothetical protein
LRYASTGRQDATKNIWLFGKFCGNVSGEMGKWPP